MDPAEHPWYFRKGRFALTKSVAILGCGPAGLMVAHAAEMAGWNFHIYSKKKKSPLFGAQYLHQEIPGLDCGPEICVTYSLVGTPEQYRHKVYGETWDGTVSPEDYLEEHSAWDLRSVYDYLWFKYGGEVEHCDLGLTGYALNHQKYDLIISTVPRTVWDNNEEHFEKSYIWALGDGDYQRVHMDRPDPFTVVCDGSSSVPWYRVSNIFGYATKEWPQWWNKPYGTVSPPVPGAARVAKPLRYTGNSAPDFIHLGRFAQWEKGVLTSDVFFAAQKVLADDKI